MARYKNPAIKQLADQQVRFSPPAIRLEQIERTERLIEEITPDSTYRYDDLCQRLTN